VLPYTARGKLKSTVDDLDYFKLCKDRSLIIQNDEFKVRVKHCVQHRVQFGVVRKTVSDEEYDVDFDFRYYAPYRAGDLVGGGLYVFKTSDKDSSSFLHKLKHIKVYNGKQTSMFVLTYYSSVGPLSQVKVKLGKSETEAIEFEVFFGALDRKTYKFG
jgi:lipopolysaccharide assembly outer membrane protein LptD (OstA)